jgi:hypothetical protein
MQKLLSHDSSARFYSDTIKINKTGKTRGSNQRENQRKSEAEIGWNKQRDKQRRIAETVKKAKHGDSMVKPVRGSITRPASNSRSRPVEYSGKSRK